MSPDDGLLRKVAQEVLAELLPDLLEEALVTGASNGGNGHRAQPTDQDADTVVPQVPAPPIAKVHRPSGWRAPEPPPAQAAVEPPAAGGGTFERVAIRGDADLDAFVQELARRLESPHLRKAIRSGEVRFRLADTATASPAAVPMIRVDAGAVTERAVRDAARAGARLVLSPRAVLTPLARDRARSLGVEIEQEARC